MMHKPYDPMSTPYEVAEQDFPRTGTLEEQFEFLLRYVIVAPSTHNTQPWKFALTPDGIEIYGDYSRRMPVVDSGNRELLMSIGAAIVNLRVAASHFGFACQVMYNYGGDSERPLAFARLAVPDTQGHPDPSLESLFSVILKRHTNRNPFLLSRIPSSVLQHLQSVMAGGRVSFFISTDGKLNQNVGELVAAAERVQQADPDFRRDNAEWIRTNWTQKSDGITGAALGVHGISSALSPWATRVLDLGRLRAASDKNLCVEAPSLIVISSEDSVPHWLEAGELLERLLLTIVREGLQCSYFNMPVQVPELRVQLRRLLGLSAWPQLLLRVGYCLIEPALTPRRPIEEVILKHVDS